MSPGAKGRRALPAAAHVGARGARLGGASCGRPCACPAATGSCSATKMSSGKNAIRMKPALVTTWSFVSPQRPSPPSWRERGRERPARSSATAGQDDPRTARIGSVTVPWPRGRRHRLRSRQGHGREPAPARRLVQARAPRPADAVRPQRLGQDDAAADARRRDERRRRPAGVRQGHADRAARPAPAARPRPVAARLRARRLRRPARDRGAAQPSSSRRWPTARPTPRRSTPTRARRPGSSTPAATTGARASTRRCTGSASATSDLDRDLATFSGGELTRASLARALAGDPDLLLLDEPTNHLDIASLEWLEKYLQSLDAAVVLVAHDRWFLEAVGTAVLELEAGRVALLQGHLARLAQGEGRARAGARPRDREAGGGDRGARALRHPLPRRHARAPGAVARQAARQDRADRPRPARRRARSASRSSRRSAPAAWSSRSRTASCGSATASCCGDAELWLERGEHVSLVGANGAGKTTLIRALAGERELDARQAAARAQRQARAALPARRGARQRRHRAGGVPARDRSQAERGARAARPVPVRRRGGREAARRALGRRAPAAVAGDPRPLRRERADPRRADEPPRPREPRGARGRAAGVPRARCC